MITMCPKHPRYQGKGKPRVNPKTGTVCWHCARVRTARRRMDEREREWDAMIGTTEPLPQPLFDENIFSDDYEDDDYYTERPLPSSKWPEDKPVSIAYEDLRRAGWKTEPSLGTPTVRMGTPLPVIPEGALQDEAPVPANGYVLGNWCRVTGKAWGASFVCPFSHTTGRRLPRAWIAYRDHIECLQQDVMQILVDPAYKEAI